jgi:anti-sigma B factor antagonist
VAGQEYLQIESRREGDMIVVGLHGELDLASAPQFESEIDSPEVTSCAKLVLDLDDLQFIDSTGLRNIFSAHARSQERGQQFAVTRGSEQVQRLLAITRVGEHLRVVDSPQEMLA